MSVEHTPPSGDELLRHADFLRGVAMGILGDPHLADDVVQDTWTAALERPPRPGNLRGWLGTVARNLSRLKLRRKARLARREAGWSGLREVASPSEIAARVEIQQRLVSELARLEEPYRAVLFHRYFDGLSPKEIADRTGESRGAVRTRLSRAHVRLRERLDAESVGPGKSRSLLPLLLYPRGAAAPSVAAAGLAAVLVPGALLMTKKIAILTVVLVGAGLALFLSGRDGPEPPPDRMGEGQPEIVPDAPSGGEEEARAEPAPRGGCSIRGKVTLDGEPAEARVEIRLRDTSLDWGSMLASPEAGEPLAAVETDEGGAFVFEGLEPRSFDLVAYGAGGTWGRARGFCAPGMPHSVSDIRLTGGRETLAGKAEHRDGRPFRGIARAWTGPWFSSGTWSRAVETDEVGRFWIEDLPAGRTGVAFLTPGETLSIFWGVEMPGSGEMLFVVDGGLTEFEGLVIVDDTEEPVGDAAVMYRGGQRQAREVVARTRSGADGRFTYRLPTAAGSFWVRKDGFAPAQIQTEGEGDFVVRLKRRGRVTGRVVKASDGSPVAGVAVHGWNWHVHGMEYPLGVSDEDGRFEAEVGPGGGMVYALGNGWVSEPLTTMSSYGKVPCLVEVGPGATADAELRVIRTGRVEGVVRTPGGSPVPGVCVTLGLPPTWRGFRPSVLHAADCATITGPEGAFAIDDLIPGFPFHLEARPREGAAGSSSEFRVEPGQAERMEIVLPIPDRFLSVRVLDRDTGDPIGGVAIAATQAGGHNAPPATTRPDGTAPVGPLLAGHAFLSLTHTDYLSPGIPGAFGRKGVLVPDPAPDEVTYRLTRGYFLAGRITGVDAFPEREAGVQVHRPGEWAEGSFGIGGRALVQSDGTFRLGPIPAGTYDLVFLVGRTMNETERARWNVTAGRTDLVLDAGPEKELEPITVKLRGPDGRPATGGLLAYGPDRVYQGYGQVLRGVPPGTRVRIEVRSPKDAAGAPLGGALHGPVVAERGSIVIDLPAEKAVAGRVLGPDGEPVSGLRVEASPIYPGLDRPAGFLPRGRTAADGSFRIGGLPDVSHRILLQVPADLAAAAPVECPAGTTDLTIRLASGARFALELKDPDGRPASGARARVPLPGRALDYLARSAQADGAGRAVLEGLDPKGTYPLTVDPPPGRTDLVPIRIAAWTPKAGPLVFERGVVTEGTVRDVAGRPVHSAAVYWREPGGEWTRVLAEISGVFTITAPAGRRIALRASAPRVTSVTGAGPEQTVDAGARDVRLTIPK